MNEKGFDIWASGYDADVLESDERGEYPFAGYRLLMDTIFQRVISGKNAKVLDVGIGTGFLASKLAENGCEIFGADFSDEMLRICSAKMPAAKLFKADFSETLPREITSERFDFIISTYALHHLTTPQKAEFVRRNMELLAEKGEMIIGDVSFDNVYEYNLCKEEAGGSFDEDEYYWIANEILPSFPELSYYKLSRCAGIYLIKKQNNY